MHAILRKRIEVNWKQENHETVKKGQRQKTAPVLIVTADEKTILKYEIWKAHHLMSLEGESFQRSPVWHLWLPLRKRKWE